MVILSPLPDFSQDNEEIKMIQTPNMKMFNQYLLNIPILIYISLSLYLSFTNIFHYEIYIISLIFIDIIFVRKIYPYLLVLKKIGLLTIIRNNLLKIFFRIITIFIGALFILIYIVINQIEPMPHCGSFCLDSLTMQYFFQSLLLMMGNYLILVVIFNTENLVIAMEN